MKHPGNQSAGGFTLIEVLVAMVVVALGIGALMTTLSSAADATVRMRDKSFAQWIALNQITSLRVSSSEQPAVGVTRGSIEDYAGRKWNWEQEVTDPGVAGILRIEVRVAPDKEQDKANTQVAAPAPSPAEANAPMPSVGSAFGFIGSSVARASGSDPDWSLSSVAGGAGGGGGGGGGGR